MKMIKKIIINTLILLVLPVLTNAKTYQFELKASNINANNITGTFNIYNGQIKKIEMANGWENKTGLNNNFYFTSLKTTTTTLVATITVEGKEDSYYQIQNLTYHNLKCQQNNYGTYYNDKGLKVSQAEYQKSCLNNNNNLKSLSLSSGKLSPAFNKDLYSYTANVSNDVTSVKITALPEVSTSKITSDNVCKLKEGLNTCNVVVKAQDGSLKIYTIKITREATKALDYTITNFTVLNADLQEAFNQDLKIYNIKVQNGQDNIYFQFIQNGFKYTSKPCDISKGATQCLLTINSLNGQKTTYTFNIIKDTPLINTASKPNNNSNNNNVEENNYNENLIPELPDQQEENKETENIVSEEKPKSKITLFKVLGIIIIGVIIGIIVSLILKKTARHHKFFV